MEIEVLLEGGPYDTLRMSLDIESETPVLVMPESYSEVLMNGFDQPKKEYLYRLHERKESGLLVYRYSEERVVSDAICDQNATMH